MGSIYYVDFLDRKLLRVEKEPETKDYVPTQESMDKTAFFNRLLAMGKVAVSFRPQEDDVEVPDTLKVRDLTTITFSTYFTPPDVVADDRGVGQTLSFNGTPFKVFIPWDSVVGIALPSAAMGRDWIDGKAVEMPTLKQAPDPTPEADPPKRA